MRKVIIYIIGTILCLTIADITFGICSKYYIKNYPLIGRYQPLDRLIKEVNTDIICIGNSAILNSVNPEIIEDSLSMTCYNGGTTGQGVFFFETIIDCILQRHTPKMFVIGLRPEEVGGNIGEGIYDVLKPYYGIGYTSIDDHFNNIGGFDRFLLHSNLLRYNTIWVRVLLYMLFDDTTYSQNGFMPKNIPAHIPQLKQLKTHEEPIKAKLECIERIIKKSQARNVDIVICYPPTLYSFNQNDDIPCVKAIKDLCRHYNVLCMIDYNNKYFHKHPELFYDNGHVNKDGADKYSIFLATNIYHLLYE